MSESVLPFVEGLVDIVADTTEHAGSLFGNSEAASLSGKLKLLVAGSKD